MLDVVYVWLGEGWVLQSLLGCACKRELGQQAVMGLGFCHRQSPWRFREPS